MSAIVEKSVDLYERWFGIPADQCPPDYYRLLGLSRFESDTARINEAADRRMELLREHQLGQFRKETQQLLNEVASARLCLLAKHEKQAYDEGLRATLRGQRLAPLPSQPEKIAANDIPIRTPEHLRTGCNDLPLGQTPARTVAGRSRLRLSSAPLLTDWRWLVPAALGLGSLLVLVLALLWRLS